MALFYQQELTKDTRLAIWHIEEEESFFLQKISLHRAITHPHKRRQHLAGRFLLPYLFADFPLKEIQIADSRKPYLQTEQYHFSISHCGDFAAAIVSRNERVGIDIEIFTKKVIRVKHKFLNVHELNFSERYQNEIKLITTLWCAKEAIYKWFSFGKVNFKENILLQPFIFENEGLIHAAFSNDKIEVALETNYKLFQNISLAWVTEEKKYPAVSGI